MISTQTLTVLASCTAPWGRSCSHIPSAEQEAEAQRGHPLAPAHTAKKRQSQDSDSSLSDFGPCSQPLTPWPSWDQRRASLRTGCSKPHYTLLSRVPSLGISKPQHSVLSNLLSKLPHRRGSLGLSQCHIGNTFLLTPGARAQAWLQPFAVPLGDTCSPLCGQDTNVTWMQPLMPSSQAKPCPLRPTQMSGRITQEDETHGCRAQGRETATRWLSREPHAEKVARPRNSGQEGIKAQQKQGGEGCQAATGQRTPSLKPTSWPHLTPRCQALPLRRKPTASRACGAPGRFLEGEWEQRNTVCTTVASSFPSPKVRGAPHIPEEAQRGRSNRASDLPAQPLSHG